MRKTANGAGNRPRTLLYSGHKIYEKEVWRCAVREFHSVIQEVEAVDLAAPSPKSWYKNGKRLALRVGEHAAIPLSLGMEPVRLNREYDLFFAVFEKPSELLQMNAIEGWKDRCKTSICLVTEFYVHEMPLFKGCLEVLKQFDHVLFMFATNEPFQKVINGRGRYMASGVDSLRFCPYPQPPQRSIDVLSIGRRSAKTHRSLLRMAAENGAFYLHDTIDDLHAYDLDEHRLLFSNLAKRSRYFIVNPGKVDVDAETGGQSEFGYRYFEGAAAGTVLIGEIPKSKEFRPIFHWEDAVVHLPYDSESIGEVIRDLDRQPERLALVRRNNITQCLSHHDWAHRWESILEIAGLEPMPALTDRKMRLKERLEIVETACEVSSHRDEALVGGRG